MKKAIFLLVTVFTMSLLSSCSDDVDNVKKNWIFTITTVVTMEPTMEGYPITTTQTVEVNGLTEAEANTYIAENSGTATLTMGDMTMITTITITKEEKK